MSGPDLSVVIPVRNGAHLIRRQLEALAGQDFTGTWETVIADNGSTDNLPDVLAEFAGRLPGLRRIDASLRPGASHARNAGAREAAGDSLIFVDADDVVGAGYLTAMHRALERAPVVGPRFEPERVAGGKSVPLRPEPPRLESFYGFWPWTGGAVGVRKTAFDRIGGFDEDFLAGEDADFSWRARLACEPLELAPEAVIKVHHHSGARAAFRKGRFWGRAGPQLYRRYRQYGMPRRGWRGVFRFYGGVILRLPRVRTREDLEGIAYLVGYRAGLLEGCLRQRVLYV